MSKKQEELTLEEKIMFGKMCGCGACKFCEEWRHEQVMQHIEELVRNGKRIAEEGREEARKEWLSKPNKLTGVNK